MKLPVRQYWQLLAAYLRPQGAQFALLVVLLLLHIGLRLANPQVMRFFIDTALQSATATEATAVTLRNAALLFFVVALITQALSVINTYFSETIAWTATNNLRLDLLIHCLKLDLSFHKAHTAGELLERIDGDVNALSSFLSRLTVYIIGNLLLIMGVLVLLFHEDWRVGLVLTVFTFISLLVMIRVRLLAIPNLVQVRAVSATFFGFLGEQLTATEDIRANGAVAYVLRRFDEIHREWLPIRVKANIYFSFIISSTIVLFGIANALSLGLGAYLWQKGLITVGTVYLIFHYTELLSMPLVQIRAQLEELQRAEASISRVAELQAATSKLVDGRSQPLPVGPLDLAIHDLSFAYEEATVLQNISLHLQPGRVLGLLGRTGSGKSTLARLILRLYDPTNGRLTLNGHDLRDLQLAHLRHRVKLVSQDVQLFQASIRDNLTFFDPHIADEQLTAVLHTLGLGDWLASQANGLDTQLGGGNGGLSAGQAQLLAFARCFLQNPGLIILDEASSRLDPATEQLIEQAIDRLLTERTGLIIAHRLGTVQRADDILILENGRILEYGPRTQLAQDPTSHFARLLQTGLQEMLA